MRRHPRTSATYNLERDALDTMRFVTQREPRKVLEGVIIQNVIFEDSIKQSRRGPRSLTDKRDLYGVVVDASGRRCMNQLKMKKDPRFNQFCIYSWFEGVKEPPERYKGSRLLPRHEQAWTWHIPLRDGKTSMGIVLDKEDFQKSGKDSTKSSSGPSPTGTGPSRTR